MDYSAESMAAMAEAWYQNEAIPLFQAHAAHVAEAAAAKQTEEHGALLIACGAGQECRQKEKEHLTEILTMRWKEILTTFRRDVKSLYLEANSEIVSSWEVATECHEQHPCCETPETEILNMYIQINWMKEQIMLTQFEIALLEEKATSIQTECPDEVAAVIMY